MKPFSLKSAEKRHQPGPHGLPLASRMARRTQLSQVGLELAVRKTWAGPRSGEQSRLPTKVALSNVINNSNKRHWPSVLPVQMCPKSFPLF